MKAKRIYYSLLILIGSCVIFFNAIVIHAKDYSARVDHPEIPRIKATEAKALFNQGKLILVNSHESSVYNRGHILGDISIPNDKIEEIKIKLPKKNYIIAFYCA